MTLRFIGDVHALWEQYLPLTEGVDSIQVGDFGAGFREIPELNPRARFIRGNHDDPAICRAHPNWIKDGTVENDIMYIGGAYSIDRAYRKEGVSWWPDEELSIKEWNDIIGIASVARPRIMVTHDCPESVIPKLFPRALPISSATQQALDIILEQYPPDLYIFGHWHYDRDITIGKTRFICLNELSYIDVNLETLEVSKF